MLRVGLDLRPTEQGFKSHYGRGTGCYTNELVEHLLKLSEQGNVELQPLGSEELAGSRWQQRLSRTIPFGRQTLETQIFLPARMRQLDVSFLHFFAHGDAPARTSIPYIVTVLDLIPLRFPDMYRADKPNWRFRLARSLELASIRNARGILAISEATKRDLMELLNIPEEQVVVTPLAVSEQFIPVESDPSARQGEKLSLRQKFLLPLERPTLLYVGGIDPRKNIFFLLEVFAELLRQSPDKGRPYLVIAGNYQSDRNYPKLLKEIERLEIQDDVRLLGFVSDEDLPALYRSADLSVFPSLYEGFGFPVLESMACGVPVLAGAHSSIPEVCGPYPGLLRDFEKSTWVSAILATICSEDRQRELGNYGVQRAKSFSWDRTARQTLEAYHYFAGRQQSRSGDDERRRAVG